MTWRGQWSPCLGRAEKWEHLGEHLDVSRPRHQQEAEFYLLLSSPLPALPVLDFLWAHHAPLTLREG